MRDIRKRYREKAIYSIDGSLVRMRNVREIGDLCDRGSTKIRIRKAKVRVIINTYAVSLESLIPQNKNCNRLGKEAFL